MMCVLCQRSPHVSTLNITWGDALELTTPQRDKLMEIINEIQTAEVQAVERESRRSVR
jgi:hypothetical protein